MCVFVARKGLVHFKISSAVVRVLGHAAPILYAAWALVDDCEAQGGSLDLKEMGPAQTELVNHLRETGHVLEGEL